MQKLVDHRAHERMRDGSDVQCDLRGVAAACGALCEPLDEAVAFLDSLEAVEKCLWIELELVELGVEATIEDVRGRLLRDREGRHRGLRR